MSIQTQWTGRYLDGRHARQHAAEITITADGLWVQVNTMATLWAYAEMRQTQGRYAGEPVRLERGADPAEVLIVADPEFLRILHTAAPGLAAHIHHPASRQRRPLKIALAALATLIAMIGAYRWGIPLAAHYGADYIPPAWEVKLGELLAGSMLQQEVVCTDPTLQRGINKLMDAMAYGMPPHPYTMKVSILENPTINAFAVPGGQLVVYTGLLQKTERPEELVGVLAHEVQHVLQRHGTKALLREFSSQALFAAVFGDAGGMAQTVAEGVRTLGSLQYSREAEAEADQRGLALLQAAKINPDGMIRFFATLEQQEAKQPTVPTYFSTHPKTTERIEALRQAATKGPWRNIQRMMPEHWTALRMRCRSQ